MGEIFSQIKEYIQGINPFVMYVILFFLGLYIFWRGCIETRKNRSSVFDIYVLSALISVIVGRVVYIILAWDSVFSSYIWYWLPYERYGDKVYLFRLLPWKFFSIWDGGLIILAVFVSMLLSLTFFSLVVKKWKWEDMFFPIFFSSTGLLGFSFIYTGITSGFNAWIYRGLILIAILIIFYLLFRFISKIVKESSHERYVLGYVGTLIVILSSVYILSLYLSQNLTVLENAFIGIFFVWSLTMSYFFISDLRKARVKIQSVSTVRSVRAG